MKYEQFLADVVQALAEVDFMGRMLSRVKSVLSATHDLVEKNGRLEKENAELRDELDDWKGNAEGFQPDSYMKLPLDADGEPIRIGDEMDIGGEIAIVKGYQISYEGSELLFIAVSEDDRRTFTLFGKNRKHFKHDTMPVDSWEKLEEDAKQHACSYFGIDQDAALCNDCPHGSSRTGRTCWQNARRDMIARAKKLAGIEGEAQR